jgi:gas vesicle protein
MNTTGKVITGFLLGAMVGAITGLLAAPVTGKRSRKTLEKKSKKLVKQLSQYVGIKNKPQRGRPARNGKASVEVV